MTFLFWNINRKPLLKHVAALVLDHNVDVLILAESVLDEERLLRALRHVRGTDYHQALPKISRVKIYSVLPKRFVRPLYDDNHMSIRRFVPPAGLDITLVGMHLPSKLHREAGAQYSRCTSWARDISEIEQRVGHSRTVVMGDMNMNPFEQGMVDALGFHAVMDRQIAAKRERRVDGIYRTFFYNPMWSHFGDSPAQPSGTYFYNSGGQINYFWNMFDQVLLRPDLLDYYSDENLRVATNAGSEPLVDSNGYPKRTASDHLPIVLQLWERPRSEENNGRLLG